jgi:hypothetical protein
MVVGDTEAPISFSYRYRLEGEAGIRMRRVVVTCVSQA